MKAWDVDFTRDKAPYCAYGAAGVLGPIVLPVNIAQTRIVGRESSTIITTLRKMGLRHAPRGHNDQSAVLARRMRPIKPAPI